MVVIRNTADAAVKGQIFWSNRNKNVRNVSAHYIIYLEPHDVHHFIGAMLTHSAGHGNIALNVTHFIAPDKINGYRVGYDNSYIVNKRLLKLQQWAPFEPVGMMSPAGIKFIDDNIGETVPELFILNAP